MNNASPSPVVVITGASAGVGRATAREFAKRGARIGLLARGPDGLEGARRDVEALGGKGMVIPTDVSHPDEVEKAAEMVEKQFGPLDIWVNNAMTSVFSPVKEMLAEEYRRVTEVTYLGYVYGTLSALKRMLPRDEGVIIQVDWREPDEGIWEIRLERKHYTFSKVMCWVTLDRLLKLHEAGHIKVPYDEFIRERDAIRSDIEARGYNEKVRSYTVSFGEEDADISLLLLPVFNYIDAKHPRFVSTFKRIEEQLGKNGLLYRYLPHYDGLPPEEGAFAAASFWAVQCLIAQGRNDDAHASFEHLLSLANHLGLFAEEIDPETGAALGNFPQAYTHVGLINAALSLSEGEIEAKQGSS